MRNKKRRLVSVVVLLCMLAQLVIAFVPAQAATRGDLYRVSALEKLSSLESEVRSEATGQYGLLTRLAAIAEYGGYLYYVAVNRGDLNVSTAEVNSYVSTFKAACDSFNQSFGTESSYYDFLVLSSDSVSEMNSFISYVESSLFTVDVVPYLSGRYAELTSEYGTMTDSEFRRADGVICELLYAFVEQLFSMQSALGSMTLNSGSVSFGYVDTLNSIIAANQDVYMFGSQLSTSTSEANRTISVDLNALPIENFANVEVTENGVEVPEDPELKLAYLAIVAASSVYTPFISYTGDPEFIAALRSLTGDEGTAQDLVSLYNSTKEYKKPLYRRALDSSGNPTGPATKITLAELETEVRAGNTGSLCTVKGEFAQVDGDWRYTVYQPSGTLRNFEESTGSVTEDESYNSNNNQTLTPNSSSDGASIENGVKWVAWSLFSPAYATTVEETVSPVNGINTTNMTVESTEFAKDTITSDGSLTDALFLYGAKYSRGIDNLTTMLLNNIFEDSKNCDALTGYEDGYLYVNAFGDIVTADNLVVFPGACNPLLYASGVEYNLYTVAFMNSYPSILQNTSYFKVASSADIGKYLVIGGYDSATGSVNGYQAVKIDAIDSVKETAPITMPELTLEFTANQGLDTFKGFATRRLIFGSVDNWKETNQFWSYIPLVYSGTMTIDGANAFPYVKGEDKDYSVSSAIAANAYDQLTVDFETSEVGNQYRLNDNYVLNYFLIQGLNGTLDAAGYEDDMYLTYKQYVESSGDRKIATLENLSQGIFDNTTGVSGVIGIKSTYQDSVYGRLFQGVKDYWYVFLLVVAIVLLFAFARVRMSVPQMVIKFVFATVVVYAFVWVIPAWFPTIYNIVTNNVAENLTYEVLGVKAEYADVYSESPVSLDASGRYNYNSTSMTLYRVPATQVQEFRDSLGAEAMDLVGGNTVVISAEAGVFAEGDAIKVNTGILFDTLKVTGTVDSASSAYQLHATKTVSSNVDYYVPYYQIVDGFIEKLNTISRIYSIPRHTTTYTTGKIKDNYLVYSYVNSRPFLTPGEYGIVIPGSELDWTPEELAAYQNQGTALEQQLTNAFGRNADWLGISDILYNLGDAEKKTLWAHTLQNNGYYDEEWAVNSDKMDELITYVNYQTRRFVYEMDSQIGKISDDVLIKLISMRALIALTQEASDFGNWMYPFSLNYQELTLGDVLSCVFISDYDKYVGMSMQVVPYILKEYGWIHLIVFDVLVILMFVVTHLINLLVPTLYVALGVLTVYKLVRGEETKHTFRGYLKVMVLLFMCSTVYTVSIVLARKMNESIISLYFLLVVTIFVAWIVTSVLVSVVTNFSELGDATIRARLTGPIGRVANAFQNFSVSNASTVVHNELRERKQGGEEYRSVYDFRAGVDDVYDRFDWDETAVGAEEVSDLTQEIESVEVDDLFDSEWERGENTR